MIKKQADRFFSWFCRPEYYDDIRGDLEELYQEKLKEGDELSADLFFARQVLLLLRLSLIRPFRSTRLLSEIMLLQIHFKTAWRNLMKYKAYSFINIFGLALGLAACLLVFSYTHFESSYDQMHPDVDQLYRVNQTAIWDPEGGEMGSTAPPLAKLLENTYPEIKAATRINTPGNQVVRYDQGQGNLLVHMENHVLAADSNFFDFFSFPLLEGDPNTALQGVGKVVISEEMAEKYFKGEPALGKMLEFGDKHILAEVTGVTAPQPDNMHFHFDFLWSMPTNANVKKFDWSFIWTQVATYIKVEPNTDVQALEAKLKALSSNSIQPTFSRLGMNYEDFVADKGGWNFYLQPLQSIHLESVGIGNRLGPIGDSSIILLLKYVAFLILLIALLNFINLATARASTRAKEIGVKKTIGAFRNALIVQFLVESITVATIAMLFALACIPLLKTTVLYFSGIDISTAFLLEPTFIPMLFLIPIGIGLLAGLYPAFYLSAFRPMDVLKGNLVNGIKSGGLRNLLVTAQFTISIALLAGTVLIYQQLKYMNQKNLGFEQEQILVLNNLEKLTTKVNSFKEEVKKLPEVDRAAISMEMPGRGTWEDIFGREGSDIKLPINQIKIDEDFFSTMGLSLVEGRAFEEGRPADVHSVIINETTKELFAWEDDIALGKRILYPEYPEELKVIGVVKDFHFQSLRQNITPLAFFHEDSDMWGDQRVLAIKYVPEQEASLVNKMEQLWQRMGTDAPFEYSYFEEELNHFYDSERSLSGLIALFSFFSLFIAIIGLIGLLAYSAEQRQKEISIRKILGASASHVFFLMSSQYLKLFLIALLLAIPLAWPTMQNWLNAFAYSVPVNIFIFLFAGLIVVALLFLSISYLTLKVNAINLANVIKE